MYRNEGGEFDLQEIIQNMQTIYDNLGITIETEDRHIPFELPQSPSLVDESDSSYHRWI
mgnify:CR=1 FL=1